MAQAKRDERTDRPLAFDTVVLKVHSRCNLSCDYCYVYTSPDRSWARRPRVMEKPLMLTVADRLAEYASRHGLDEVTVILHGGEPLLAGRDRIGFLAGAVRAAFEGLATTVHLVLQTNGTLLDVPVLRVLDRWGVTVGVSVDGGAAEHDRHRRYPSGRASHDRVAAALDLLRSPAHRHLFGGLLCTVDLENDPVTTYESLAEHEPPVLDFLLPHGTWEAPPPRLPSQGTPYADWLIAVFERWWADSETRVRIRMFDSLFRLGRGGSSLRSDLGTAPVTCVIVETDGAIEVHDNLKIVYEGAGVTGRNVMRDGFDGGGPVHEKTCAACARCPVFTICGGGTRAHRYRAVNGFDNPTVYCADMRRLIEHVERRVSAWVC
ncbi:hypothetical protein BJF83_08795 [Nocardiopsis sp. CNR-923]|nr:hypothetical protein BJF83_08795 [Nocardiopsis sp. CNR-923]